MLVRWLLAAVHLLALGIGLGAIWARARWLRSSADPRHLRYALAADTWWGLAALLWIGTGLWRLLAGTEKPTEYYLHNHAFWAKMAALALVLVLELRPMLTLMRWRRDLARSATPNTMAGPTLSRISYLQAALIVIMVLAATAMARGLGVTGFARD
jgi:putative membrane protein